MAASETAPELTTAQGHAAKIDCSRVSMWAALVPIFIYLVLPSLIVIPIALTSSSIIDFPPPSLSLKTFSRFFHDSAWISAIASSFIIALIVMVLAVIVGTLAAIGLSGSKFRGRGLIVGLILMPLAVPVVVLGLGDFAFLARLGKWFTGIQLVGTRTGIALSQSVLAVPYVFIVMSASLAGLNPQLVRSAQSLGAGTIALFRHVYFPVVKMGLIASALFAFIVSWDEPVVAYFLQGPDATTLPVKMYSDIQFQLTPLIAVSSTILLAISTIIFVSVMTFIGRQSRPLPVPGMAISTDSSPSEK